MRDARLFNCCTNHEPPDWSRFDRLGIEACAHDGPDGFVNGVSEDKAELWSIYAVIKGDEGDELITDAHSRADVDAVAAELSALSGLQVQ